MELSGIQSELIHMKKVHSEVVKESEEKISQYGDKFQGIQREKEKIDSNFKELQTIKMTLESKQEKLVKTIDDLEKVKKEKEKEIGNFHLQITDLRTKQFDTEFFLRDEQDRNKEFIALTNEQKIKIDKLEASNIQMNKELVDNRDQILKLKNEKENQNTQIDNLIKTKSMLSDELDKMKDQVQNLNNENNELNAHVIDLTSVMTQKDKDIDELQQKIVDGNQRISEIQKERDEKISSLDETHGAEIRQLKKEVSLEKKLVADYLENIKSLNENSAEKDKQIIEQKNIIEKIKKNLEETEANGHVLSDDNKNLKDKNNELQDNVKKAEAFAGNCIVEKNELKTSMQTTVDDLSNRKDAAEESLQKVTLELESLKSKLGECKTEADSGKK